jgi:hypothetical protein
MSGPQMNYLAQPIENALMDQYTASLMQNRARNQLYALPGFYDTPLAPAEEKQFRQWVKDKQIPFDPNSAVQDYDMRGFYKAMLRGDPNAATGINRNDGQLHFGDYFKTPYHKSFSAESKYAKQTAPRWNEQDQLVLPDGTVVFDERAQK